MLVRHGARTLVDVTASLATRYRPRRLADVVGQRHATSVLRRAVLAGTLPQQLLFSGGSGLGKTTLARCVAAALLCETPVDGDACMECESCRDISTAGRIHPDVVEFDAASNGQKEQIKELASRAATAPVRGKHRIYIIDEAHGLSLGGGQAFLKLLEEPPPHVIFMLATTDPEKMLRTNRGRCIEFELHRPSDDEIAEHLVKVATAEGWELTDEAARAVLAATDPALGLRGLLMTLEKLSDTLAWGVPPSPEEVAALLGLPPASTVAGIVAAIDAHDRPAALAALQTARKTSSDQAIRRALSDVFRSRLFADATPLAAWRFEQLVTAPAGPLWTELVCCRMAAPELAPDAAALAAHAQEAAQRLDRLAQQLADSPPPAPPAAPAQINPAAEKKMSANSRPGAAPTATPPVAEEKRPAKRTEDPLPVKPAATKATPASTAKTQRSGSAAQGTSPGSKADTSSAPAGDAVLLAAFLASLSSKKQAAAVAAVKAANPRLDGSKLTLDPPTAALRTRLEQHRAAIREAAAANELTVTITRTVT